MCETVFTVMLICCYHMNVMDTVVVILERIEVVKNCHKGGKTPPAITATAGGGGGGGEKS